MENRSVEFALTVLGVEARRIRVANLGLKRWHLEKERGTVGFEEKLSAFRSEAQQVRDEIAHELQSRMAVYS